MLIYLFLTSGLFLGWSLGANDAANIFGTAVGSRMVSFKKAAIIASIFVILGSVIQGHGATKTLSELGAVDALGGAFTIALCAAIIVTLMTRYKLPVSTGQAIVGAIIGWSIFSAISIDIKVLIKIFSTWISGPILGAIFSALLYILMRKIIRNTRMHLLRLEAIIRLLLIVVGAFGAYSLGANNIANVMGVFVNSINFDINIGSISFHSTELLFLLGSIAISIGIFTYSKKVMDTVGNGIISMTPEAAIVVVLSQALVLFIFSSSTLSNAIQSIGLPPIPLVPVSSTQVVIGSVLGIGMVKGVQELQFKVVGRIMLGWLLTPLLAGIFTFISLFFVQEVFGINVNQKGQSIATNIEQSTTHQIAISYSLTDALLTLAIITTCILIVMLLLRNSNKSSKKQAIIDTNEFENFRQALTDIEKNTVQLENNKLATRLEEKRKELVNFSINLSEQKQHNEAFFEKIQMAYNANDIDEKNQILKETITLLKQKNSFNNDIDSIYSKAEELHAGFYEKLNTEFPELSATDKKLMMLLRIGLSSKEIASLFNISTKSVEISRYRLRKKLQLQKDTSLIDFCKNISY